MDEMERVTGMWPGDVEIYKAEHTMITFKRWLLGKVGRDTTSTGFAFYRHW